MIAALTKREIEIALDALPGWTHDETRNALYRSIEVADFSVALGMMMRIGLEAEKADHHPEWHNVYNRIQIWLTTHDAGNAISARDIALARAINAIG